MKNLKKVLALVLVVVMALGLITVSNAKSFTDGETITKKEAVAVLSEIGVIDGMPDESFQPEGDVTRAQMAKMVSVIMNSGDDVGELYKDACKFADVPATHWAAGHIAYCAQAGIINGKSATAFDPEGKVTGTEAAKMLLCALGYKAEAEGYVGPAWASAVLARAADARLVGKNYNLTAAMGEPLNRENAAQMMFNALKADVVEYSKSGAVISTSDGVTINTGSEWSVKEKPTNSEAANISKTAGKTAGTYTVQLGEEKFDKLKLSPTATTDKAHRPVDTWTYKNNEIIRAPHAVEYTFKDTMTGAELYTALGKPEMKASLTSMDDLHVTYYIDGELYWDNQVATNPISPFNGEAGSNPIATIASGISNDFARIGSCSEIYMIDGDSSTCPEMRIVQTNYYTAIVSSVHPAELDANGDVTVPEYVILSDKSSTAHASTAQNDDATVPANGVESTGFTSADVGARVIYTVAHVASGYQLQTVEKAQSTSGLYNKRSTKTVTIAGTDYKFIPNTNVTGAQLNKDATIYTDPNGNVVFVEGVESSDYAVVLASASATAFDESKGILLFADGTKKTVVFDKDYAAATYQWQIVTYSTNADGKYMINLLPTTNTAGRSYARYNTATPTYDHAVTVFTDSDTTLPARDVKANTDTTFIIETADTDTAVYTTYVGASNTPKITATQNSPVAPFAGSTNSYAAVVKDGVARFVFIFGATVENASTKTTVLFLHRDDNEEENDTGHYYIAKALVDGEQKEVKLDYTNFGTTSYYGGLSSTTPYMVVVAKSLNLDKNGVVTGVTAETLGANTYNVFNTFASDAFSYTGSYDKGVITVVLSTTPASYGTKTEYFVNENLPVYVYNNSNGKITTTTIGAYKPQLGKLVKLYATYDTNTANAEVPTAFYAVEIP